MAEPASQNSRSAALAELADLPSVELETRHGGRTASYALSHVDFLVGTVPGCDLRVPGAELPAVLCLLARRPGGVSFRKLAPTTPILVNGQAAAHAMLGDGDRVTLGALDLFVRVKSPGIAAVPRPVEARPTEPRQAEARPVEPNRDEFRKQVEQLRAQVARFHEERKAFDLLKEQQRQEMDGRRQDLDERERAFAAARKEAPAARPAAINVPPAPAADVAVAAKTADLDKQQQELAAKRQELADIRKQLYDRYQERRDRLAALQEAVNRAAAKVQERKRQVDAEEQQAQQRRQAESQRQAELDKQAATLEEQGRRLKEERRVFEENQKDMRADLEGKLADLQTREDNLAGCKRDLDARERQHQADVLRLDRLQGVLDDREKKSLEEARAVEAKLVQLRSDSADLEEQAAHLDSWRDSLQQEADLLAKQKTEHDAAARDLAQRLASAEGQQATLAALRTRLERMREEVRTREQQVDKDRALVEAAQAELERQRLALSQLQTQLQGEERLREQERQQLTERSAVLDSAVSQLRQAQDKIADREIVIDQRGVDIDKREAVLAEQEGIVQGRLRQLAESQERLDLERQAVRERTQALTQTELAREALQEQLRKRSEELAQRQKALNEKLQDIEAQTAGIEARKVEVERQYLEAQGQLDSARKQQADLLDTVQKRQDELARREAHHREQYDQLQVFGRDIAWQRKSLAEEREVAKTEQDAWLQTQAQSKAAFEGLRQEAIALARQLPDVELRAGTAMERLTHAREQLKDHLAELHAYVQECRDDLDNLRERLQHEQVGVHGQEQTLRKSQEEHRLAMVAFRQQMIGWQGQIVDLKRLLAKDETRLERRQAFVQEQVNEIDAASVKLSEKVGALEEVRKEVVGKRHEMDRHLGDMREWYRRKLRELAGVGPESGGRGQSAGGRGQGSGSSDMATRAVVPMLQDGSAAAEPGDEDALVPTGRDILSLTEPVDPGDRTLGDLLIGLDLVERDALGALLVEARRQRRSLRQVLLASGVVTLYQLALIEAGNVAGLMLGPVRVVDRLRVAPHETVYRVFDPRHGADAVLRHLAEADMLDPVRPDEFRRSFERLTLPSPHLAATLEVLDIAGRPAALQEWLTGLPAGDWPPLAAAPGVCFRLFTQAALALDTLHKAGLVHGNLTDGAIILAGDGTLKITGAAEPTWLRPAANTTAAGDLRALGGIVSGWCTPAGVRKGPKTKPLPEALVAILDRLAADGSPGYGSAAELLDELDRAGSDVPPNAEAWDRLLRYVREHATAEAVLRRSA